MRFRLPLAVDLKINAFNGATITELESGITNGIIEDGKLTQRPSIDVFEDAGTHVADARGRGIFYWDEASALYIINNGTLYKNSQASVLSTAPTAGSKKCKFLVVAGTLLLIDTENSEAFTITTGGTVTEITDTDFPPKQASPVSLAYGGAILDGYFFVMGTDGVIYNSNLLAPATWDALGFISAERDPDGGQYLGKHHDNLVALGVKTTEFFYDNANSVGSPLNRRQDISYNIGCSNGESVWEEGDRMFFVGVNSSGALGVYTLVNFSIKKVSSSSIDSFLTQAIVKDGYTAVGSGLSAQGHVFYILTVHLHPDDIIPYITLVFDSSSGLWGEWETSINDITKFPLIDWTTRTGVVPRYGEGILSNGDLITINDNMIPQDTLLATTYVTEGYVETGYISDSGGAGTAITMKSRIGMYDGGADVVKFASDLRHVGDLTTTSQNLTIRWANENNSSFNAGTTVDTSKFSKIRRMGMFRRRNHEIEYSGDEIVRLEALEGNLNIGDS